MASHPKTHKKKNKSKKPLSEDLVPIVFGNLLPTYSAMVRKKAPKDQKVNNRNNKPSEYVKILLDSGASASIVHERYVRNNNYSLQSFLPIMIQLAFYYLFDQERTRSSELFQDWIRIRYHVL